MGDGQPDIVTAGRHGVLLFLNRLCARRQEGSRRGLELRAAFDLTGQCTPGSIGPRNN
jgi:hypothetical protein